MIDYQNIFYSLPDSYFIVDIDAPKFTILNMTDQNLINVGMKRDELIGNGLFQMFPDNPKNKYKNAAYLRESLVYVIEKQRTHFMDVMRYDIPISGSTEMEFKYWSIQNHPYFENGILKYIIITGSDITSVMKVNGLKI